MKFRSALKNKSYALANKVGIVGNYENHDIGNLWQLECLEKRFQCEKVNQYDIDTTDCKILIFPGNCNLETLKNKNIKYYVLGYATDFKKGNESNEFVKNAKIFTVRDECTFKHFDYGKNITSDSTVLFPLETKLHQTYGKLSKIKIMWSNNLESLLKTNVEYDKYVGPVSLGIQSMYLKMRTLLEEVATTTTEFIGPGSEISKSYLIKKIPITKILISQFIGYDLIVTTDYYVALAAIQLKIPVIAINTSPSIKILMEECLLSDYCIDVKNIHRIKDYVSKIPENKKFIVNLMHEFVKSRKRKMSEIANAIEEDILVDAVEDATNEVVENKITLVQDDQVPRRASRPVNVQETKRQDSSVFKKIVEQETKYVRPVILFGNETVQQAPQRMKRIEKKVEEQVSFSSAVLHAELPQEKDQVAELPSPQEEKKTCSIVKFVKDSLTLIEDKKQKLLLLETMTNEFDVYCSEEKKKLSLEILKEEEEKRQEIEERKKKEQEEELKRKEEEILKKKEELEKMKNTLLSSIDKTEEIKKKSRAYLINDKYKSLLFSEGS